MTRHRPRAPGHRRPTPEGAKGRPRGRHADA